MEQQKKKTIEQGGLETVQANEIEAGLFEYNFPLLGLTVKAKSLEEAQKMVEGKINEEK